MSRASATGCYLLWLHAWHERDNQGWMCSTGNSVKDAFEPELSVCQESGIPFMFYMTLVWLRALNPWLNYPKKFHPFTLSSYIRMQGRSSAYFPSYGFKMASKGLYREYVSHCHLLNVRFIQHHPFAGRLKAGKGDIRTRTPVHDLDWCSIDRRTKIRRLRLSSLSLVISK